MQYELTGRTAIITGASQGLGLEIAGTFAKAGANLILCARDQHLLEQAGHNIRAVNPTVKVTTIAADVSKPDDVTVLVKEALNIFPRIHILVNNAGIYGPMGPSEEVDWEMWTQALAINLCGSVLMCRALIPHFKHYRYGKIIQISGGGAVNPLPGISAYATSKAAVVRFAETIAEELRDYSIDVNAIAPGALNTRMLDQALSAGPAKVGARFHANMLKQKAQGGVPLAKGAGLAQFLAAEESDGITGKLLSAVWDPWERLGQYRDILEKSDIYTLRRIVPDDRGQSWEKSTDG